MDDAAQAKAIAEANHVIRVQLAQMMHCLDADQVMDALKAASAMLAELRTSALSPKAYYDLYVPVFDALRHLSAYLLDAHLEGRHHLADLYELVQYCGNVVPRLYLMITVGSVYMSIDDAPIKEVMRDMMEMSRGLQHPTRGLFLRNYLSGVTRDHLPTGSSLGPEGNLQDSIGFVLTNFIEMNKLWVRLQHQGPSREREKRENERRELRILIGTNLVRLSELEGVDLELYRSVILPSILEQVVNCKDVIAQDYLMEVVIQVFPDHFHIYTLSPFLQACSQLHPKVNIKNIVISLINRIAAYAQREADNDDAEEVRRQNQLANWRLIEKTRQLRLEARQGRPPSPSAWEQVRQEDVHSRESQMANPAMKTIMGAPTPPAQDQGTPSIPNKFGSARPNIATHGGDFEEETAWIAPAHTALVPPPPEGEGETAWASASDSATSNDVAGNGHNRSQSTATEAGQEMHADFAPSGSSAVPPSNTTPAPLEQLDEVDEHVETFRGVPVTVPLFEVFWAQVVNLVQARPDLSLPDITALLVALLQLSLACYPDRIEYVNQVLRFAGAQLERHAQAGDPFLLAEETQTNLSKLLGLPIDTYSSTLTLLALPHYKLLLDAQQYGTRRHISQAIVWSTLKNETILATPEDVDGILNLCGTLVVLQRDAPAGPYDRSLPSRNSGGQDGQLTRAEAQMHKEQGWLAQLVHQFRADQVDTQFALLQAARAHFVVGGDRVRYTLPVLVFAAVELARRFKLEENVAWAENSEPRSEDAPEDAPTGHAAWVRKMETLYKFMHQIIDLLYTRIESSSVSDLSLRLYLFSAQSADQCGFQEQAYDFFVQAFTVYEESISESRAQLQAIGLVISTLQTTRGFGEENYDRLITKATLHGAKLLKKPHQATAVLMASHMWWQTDPPLGDGVPTVLPSHNSKKPTDGGKGGEPKQDKHGKQDLKARDSGKESKGVPNTSKPSAPLPTRDGKRVLECLQKALRIANSCIDERSTVEIFCSALDQYLYYFEQGVEQIQPRFLNSLVELISAGLDALTAAEPPLAPQTGLVEGATYPDACLVQFRAQLRHMLTRKRLAQEALERRKDATLLARTLPDWNGVSIQGAVTKWGIS